MSLWDWRKLLKIWGPPLAGIAGMVILARLFTVAHYFLFVHHLFWIASVILLLNPLSETFWPSPEVKERKQILPQPSPKARARAEARKLMEKQKPAISTCSTSGTPIKGKGGRGSENRETFCAREEACQVICVIGCQSLIW